MTRACRPSRRRRSPSLAVARRCRAAPRRSPRTPTPAPAPAPTPAPEPSKIDVGGFVDVYYGYNFNKVDPAAAHLRRAAQHVLAEPGRGELREGADRRQPGRLPRPTSTSARPPTSSPPTSPASDGKEIYKHIQQAYVSLLTGKVQWDAGKFVTPMGAEVIESQDNWNYTRSILFGYAIPFYHVGVRATVPVNDKVIAGGLSS